LLLVWGGEELHTLHGLMGVVEQEGLRALQHSCSTATMSKLRRSVRLLLSQLGWQIQR